MINSWNEALEALLAAWDETGLDMPKRQRTSIKKAVNNGSVLPDSVMARIKNAVQSHTPDDTFISLLDQIDRYYGAPLTARQHEKELSELLGEKSYWGVEGSTRAQFQPGFDAAIQLLGPLVPLQRIITMQSLTVKALGVFEGYFKEVGLPRTRTEAEQAYEALLTLPKTYQHEGEGTVEQAATAQVLFANLLAASTDKGSEQWLFFKQCLEGCPDYLLDIPASGEPGTGLPAMLMGSIADRDYLAIMAARGSAELRRSIAEFEQYHDKQSGTAAILATSASAPTTALAERVAPGQEKLVALCAAADELLGDRHPDVALLPGVADEQIEKLNAALGELQLSEDVKTLFRWHDGIPWPRGFLGFPEPMSIEAAFQEYRDAAEVYAEFGWSKVWFPVGSEFGESRIVVLAEEETAASPVYHFVDEDDTLALEHESVEAMLRTYIEAYGEGAAKYDEVEEMYEFKKARLREIRKRHSPTAFNPKMKKMARYSTNKPEAWPKLWQKYKLQAVRS